MHDSTIKLKNGEEIIAVIWEVNRKERWFSIVDVAGTKIMMDDCESVVTKGLRTRIDKVEDADMLERWARP